MQKSHLGDPPMALRGIGEVIQLVLLREVPRFTQFGKCIKVFSVTLIYWNKWGVCQRGVLPFKISLPRSLFPGPIWRWIEMLRKQSPERWCHLPQRPSKESMKPAMQRGPPHCGTSASLTHYFMHRFSVKLGSHHGRDVSFLMHFSKNLKTNKLMELS